MEIQHANIITEWERLQSVAAPRATVHVMKSSYGTVEVEIRGITADPVRVDTVKEAFAFFAGYRANLAATP
jgi:hypothetical protein